MQVGYCNPGGQLSVVRVLCCHGSRRFRGEVVKFNRSDPWVKSTDHFQCDGCLHCEKAWRQCIPINFMTPQSFSVILLSHTCIGNLSQVRLNLHWSWLTDRCNWHRLWRAGCMHMYSLTSKFERQRGHLFWRMLHMKFSGDKSLFFQGCH